MGPRGADEALPRTLLARLVERHAISEDLVRKLLSWRHPGFSAHAGEAIPFEDKKALEDVACYLVRAPLSLKKLVYLDGQKVVLYRSKMNPFLGRNLPWTRWNGWPVWPTTSPIRASTGRTCTGYSCASHPLFSRPYHPSVAFDGHLSLPRGRHQERRGNFRTPYKKGFNHGLLDAKFRAPLANSSSMPSRRP